MKVNLSLVLDENCEVRLDLMKNINLEEIDKYTTSKKDHNEIREDYKEEIEKYLTLNKAYTDTFKRESNKKGSIVITLLDENNYMRKLRVLYNKNINKLDTDKLINRIIATLKNLNDYSKTLSLIVKYKNLMFNSPFEKNNIREANYRYKNILTISDNEVKLNKLRNINNNLLLMLKNKFIGLNKGSDSQKEICYYYLRLIDSYIENNFKVYTTKETVNTKIGTININVNEVGKEDKKTLKKETVEFNGQKMIVEDDGQFSIFSDETEYKETRTRISDLFYEENFYDRDEIINHGKR